MATKVYINGGIDSEHLEIKTNEDIDDLVDLFSRQLQEALLVDTFDYTLSLSFRADNRPKMEFSEPF